MTPSSVSKVISLTNSGMGLSLCFVDKIPRRVCQKVLDEFCPEFMDSFEICVSEDLSGEYRVYYKIPNGTGYMPVLKWRFDNDVLKYEVLNLEAEILNKDDIRTMVDYAVATYHKGELYV